MKVAVCMIVKNEESSVAEWLAYHIAIGFDTIIVFDNASTDHTPAIVNQFSGNHDVRCINWSLTSPDYQIQAYDFALATFRNEFDWMCFIDSDEFIVLSEDQTIQGFFTRVPACPAIAVNWAIFGSSGHQAKPAGLVIENFTRRSEGSFDVNRHVKSFINPRRTIACENPHFFIVDGEYQSPSGGNIEWERPGVMSAQPDYGMVQVNHYFTKSSEQWDNKIRRGYHDIERERSVFAAYDRNEVEDTAILRFIPATKAILTEKAGCLPD